MSKNVLSPKNSNSMEKKVVGSPDADMCSRFVEKEQLAGLNNRLACYIDKVRSLESENRALKLDIKILSEDKEKKYENIRYIYDGELTEARKLIDEISTEKAKLEIDSKCLFERNEHLEKYYEKASYELDLVRKDLALKEAELQEMVHKYEKTRILQKNYVGEIENLKKDLEVAQQEILMIREELKNETLNRVEKENAVISLKEQLALKNDIEKSLESSRINLQSKEINEVIENQLFEKLQELREDFEDESKRNKEELEKSYTEKISNLKYQLTSAESTTKLLFQELNTMKKRNEELTISLSNSEQEKSLALKEIKKLEKHGEEINDKFMKQIEKFNQEMNQLRGTLTEKTNDYQELMNIKVALDMEISAYRKLLEGEEERLNITPSNASVTRRNKRKRKLSEGEKIELDVCPFGRFIKIINNDSNDLAISNWKLHQDDGKNHTTFTFSAKTLVKAKRSLTVWSANCKEEAPNSIDNVVMKKNWLGNENAETTLKDNKIIVAKASKSNILASTFSMSNTSIYDENNEKCSIM